MKILLLSLAVFALATIVVSAEVDSVASFEATEPRHYNDAVEWRSDGYPRCCVDSRGLRKYIDGFLTEALSKLYVASLTRGGELLKE